MCLGLALVSLASQGGEKIQFSESTNKVELPKKAWEFETLPSSAPFSPKPDFGGAEFIPQAPSLNPKAVKKLQEDIDKARNWMFADPKGMDFDLSDSDKPGKKKNKDGDLKLEDDRPGSQIDKYWKNKEEEGSKRGAARPRDDRFGGNREEQSSLFSKDSKDSRLDRRDDQDGPMQEFGVIRSLLNQNSEDQQAARVADRYENRTFSIHIAERPQATSDERRQSEAEDKARQAAFTQVLRNLTPSLNGLQDPVNAGMDATRQELNPIAPPRSDRGTRSVLSDQGGQSASTAAASPAHSFDIPKPTGIENFSGRMPTAPSYSANSAANPVISAPRFTPAPAVLEMPRRKF